MRECFAKPILRKQCPKSISFLGSPCRFLQSLLFQDSFSQGIINYFQLLTRLQPILTLATVRQHEGYAPFVIPSVAGARKAPTIADRQICTMKHVCVTLDMLSTKFFISKSHLCNSFKKTVGITVNEYILHRRIMLAKQLMETDTSWMEICHQCGFNSYTSFARCFKKTSGFAPKEYRKNPKL